MRKLWHRTDEKDWHQVELHDIDAAHALEVDPECWKAEKPEPEAVEIIEDTE